MISEHWDTGTTEVFKNEKAQKSLCNLLSLSEEFTLHYLTGAWLYGGSCLREEIFRNLIQVFVDHNGLVLLHNYINVFPSKDLEF